MVSAGLPGEREHPLQAHPLQPARVPAPRVSVVGAARRAPRAPPTARVTAAPSANVAPAGLRRTPGAPAAAKPAPRARRARPLFPPAGGGAGGRGDGGRIAPGAATHSEPLREALGKVAREDTQADGEWGESGEFCDENVEDNGEGDQGDRDDITRKRRRAYATPLSVIFGTGDRAAGASCADGGDGAQESGEGEGTGEVAASDRPAAGALDPSDVEVLETEADHYHSVAAFTVRTRTAAAPIDAELGADDRYHMVRRALADFTWLEQTLRQRYEALIVPALPPMALSGRLKYGYAYDYERRRGLERFLRRVVAHTVLSTVDEVLAFLGVLGEESWVSIRCDVSPHQSVIASALFGRRAPEDTGMDALQWLSRWGSYKMWQTGRRLNKGIADFLERSDPTQSARKEDTAEARLARLKSYIDDLGASLAALRRAAARASQTRDDHARADDTLDDVLSSLGEKEGGQFGRILQAGLDPAAKHVSISAAAGTASAAREQDGSVGSAGVGSGDGGCTMIARSGLKDTSGVRPESGGAGGTPSSAGSLSGGVQPFRSSESDFASSASSVSDAASSTRMANASDKCLAEVLWDYEQRANGARRIMNARIEEQEAYEHASEVYTRLRDKMEVRTGSMWEPNDDAHALEVARGRGVEELYKDVMAAAAALTEARKQYQEVALATTDELRRLRDDMHVETAAAMADVARENAQHHYARAAAWAQLGAQCEGYGASGGAGVGSRARGARDGAALRRSASSSALLDGGAYGDVLAGQ